MFWVYRVVGGCLYSLYCREGVFSETQRAWKHRRRPELNTPALRDYYYYYYYPVFLLLLPVALFGTLVYVALFTFGSSSLRLGSTVRSRPIRCRRHSRTCTPTIHTHSYSTDTDQSSNRILGHSAECPMGEEQLMPVGRCHLWTTSRLLK